MIQRIQSVYLLIVSGLSAAAALLPLFYISLTTGELYDLYAGGLRSVATENITPTYYMLALAIGAAVLPFVNIFLFKKRMLQVRLCVVEVVLLFGFYAMVGAYFYLSCRVFGDIGIATKGVHPALFAPLVSIVLSLFAAKAIFQDELLVRSVDRIR